MKVLYLQNIPQVAQKGEIREVSDGYARNYLFPHKLAVVATPEAETVMKNELRLRDQQKEREAAQTLEVFRTLSKTGIMFRVPANEHGTLFAKISSADIAQCLLTQYSIHLKPASIKLDAPISSVGKHTAVLKPHEQNPVTITINVERKNI